MRALLIGFILASICFASTAMAESVCVEPGRGGDCLRYGDRSAGVTTRAAFKVKLPKGDGLIPHQAIYNIKLKCEKLVDLPVDVQSGVLSDTATVASHTIAFTKTKVSGNSPITTDLPVVHVYTLAGGKADRSAFVDPQCSTSFYVSGRDKIYLAVSVSKGETHTPSAFLNAMYAVADTVFPLWTLFVGSDIEDIVRAKLDRAKEAQAPLKTALQTMDFGGSSTYPYDVRIGTTTITTEYSRVVINVSEVPSLISEGPDTLNDYESTFPAMTSTLFPDDATIDRIAQTCGKFATTATFKGFSPDDIAYALSFTSVLANITDKEKALKCMGNKDYATRALAFSFWSSFPGRKWTSDDIGLIFFKPPGGDSPVQPSRLGANSSFFNEMMWAMGRYAQTKANPQPGEIDSYLSPKITLSNTSTVFDFLHASVSPVQLLDVFRTKGIVRFGCVTADTTGGAGMFLAFADKPSTGRKYTVRDILVMHAWLTADHKVGALVINTDGTSISAASDANKKFCGQTVELE